LKHPFEPAGLNSAILPEDSDDLSRTVMSYDGHAAYPGSYLDFNPTGPMFLDIQAAQYLYGPNLSYHAGDDVYVYHDDQPYLECIWDAGGNDTIQYDSSSGDGAVITLVRGRWSDVGLPNAVHAADGHVLTNQIGSVVIYGSVTIEYAIGGSGPDSIYGNSVDNMLRGDGGNDTIWGGAGNDWIEGDSNADAGASGNDVLLGEAGNDIIFGGSGNDVVAGGPGFDTIVGEAGNDALNGEAGNDAIDGGDGDDTLLAGTIRTSCSAPRARTPCTGATAMTS
jgi:serralysin